MITTLQIAELSERHPGLTKSLGDAYAEAAAVCLQRHHQSPAEVKAVLNGEQVNCLLPWKMPERAALLAHANEIDATECGAYAVSLATIEALEGLVVVGRAHHLTGTDFYVAPVGTQIDDYESCFRLEVSGVNAGGQSAVNARLREKMLQAAKGKSNLPAIAAVVGFRERLVAIAELGESE